MWLFWLYNFAYEVKKLKSRKRYSYHLQFILCGKKGISKVEKSALQPEKAKSHKVLLTFCWLGCFGTWSLRRGLPIRLKKSRQTLDFSLETQENLESCPNGTLPVHVIFFRLPCHWAILKFRPKFYRIVLKPHNALTINSIHKALYVTLMIL
jgi:hypothetical protein